MSNVHRGLPVAGIQAMQVPLEIGHENQPFGDRRAVEMDRRTLSYCQTGRLP